MKDNFNTQLDCLPPKQMVQVTKLLFKSFIREHLLPMASELHIAPWTTLYVEHTLHTLQQMSLLSTGVKTHDHCKRNSSDHPTKNSPAPKVTGTGPGRRFHVLESHLPVLSEWFSSYGTGSNMSQHNPQQHETFSRSKFPQLPTESRIMEVRTTHKSATSMHVPNGVLSLKQCCAWAGRSTVVPRLMSDAEFRR